MTQYDIELEHEGAHGLTDAQRDEQLGTAVGAKLRSDKLKRAEGAELTSVGAVNVSGVSTTYTVELATEPSGPATPKPKAPRKRAEAKPATEPEPVPVVTTDDVVEPEPAV